MGHLTSGFLEVELSPVEWAKNINDYVNYFYGCGGGTSNLRPLTSNFKISFSNFRRPNLLQT